MDFFLLGFEVSKFFVAILGTNQSMMQNYQMLDAPYMGDINTASFDQACCPEPSSQYSMGMVSCRWENGFQLEFKFSQFFPNNQTTHSDGRAHQQFVTIKQELSSTFFDTSQLMQSPNSSTDERDESYDEAR